MTIRSPSRPAASSAVAIERVLVWLGGVVFVTSLAFTAYVYLVAWSNPPPRDPAWWKAVAANLTLFTGFAAHHSLFAREAAKAWLSRVIPDRLLRSFYVWVASLLWLAVLAWWQPVGGRLFHHTGGAAAAHAIVQLAGVWLIGQSVRAIDGLELAGIRAGLPAGLQVHGPYRIVRHPLYLGWMLIVFGAATMTGDRLAFAAITSLYLVVAVPWEERSLTRAFGDRYRHYMTQVRWRVLPYVY